MTGVQTCALPISDPEKGLAAAIVAVPDLGSARDTQKAILMATFGAWQGSATGAPALGAIDTASWSASLEFMTTLGLVPNPVKVEDLIRSDLLPK